MAGVVAGVKQQTSQERFYRVVHVLDDADTRALHVRVLEGRLDWGVELQILDCLHRQQHLNN